MTHGLMIFATASQTSNGLLFAQFGGTKSFYLDLVLIAGAIGGAVYVVCRSSRRY